MQNIYRHSNSKLFSLFLETAPFSTSFPKCFVPTGSSRAPKSCARVSQSQMLHRPPETRRCHNPKLNWVCSLNQTMSRLVHWLGANERLVETAKMEGPVLNAAMLRMHKIFSIVVTLKWIIYWRRVSSFVPPPITLILLFWAILTIQLVHNGALCKYMQREQSQPAPRLWQYRVMNALLYSKMTTRCQCKRTCLSTTLDSAAEWEKLHPWNYYLSNV